MVNQIVEGFKEFSPLSMEVKLREILIYRIYLGLIAVKNIPMETFMLEWSIN